MIKQNNDGVWLKFSIYNKIHLLILKRKTQANKQKIQKETFLSWERICRKMTNITPHVKHLCTLFESIDTISMPTLPVSFLSHCGGHRHHKNIRNTNKNIQDWKVKWKLLLFRKNTKENQETDYKGIGILARSVLLQTNW